MQGIARDTIVDGRYRVIERIGSGGMADVYRAEDLELGREVALKLLYRRFAEDPEFVERFRREASSAAALSHPNIVQVFDRGGWDGTYYIAMELLHGRTLKEIVREHGALDPALAVDLTIQVLNAARFAHKRGIVHRDIKPHNVIVDDDGRAKVTDFGIARAGSSDMTETGSIMGTAQYLSPEQAQGHPVDERSDLYSIGIVLYELLSGVVPFDAESPVTIALKQVTELPVPPRQINPAVPPALEAVVLRALEKDPVARFQSADEFIAALEDPVAVRYVEPVVVDDPIAVLEEADRRNWRRIAVIALILLLLAAAAVGAYLLLRPNEQTVPDVVGKKSATAAQILQDRGFEVDVVPIRSATAAEDRVVKQRPDPGSKATKGSTVTISVSSGPGEAPVPLVAGQPADQAAAKLRSAGFKPVQRRELSDTVKAGRVISTSPPEGSSVRRGSKVTLVVSRGKPKAAVPDVRGQPRDQAEQALQAAGFQTAVTEKEDSKATPGTVLQQSPTGGTQLTKGATVKLVVAKAPPKLPVPDVTGMPQAEATQALQDVGFKVKVKQRDAAAGEQPDSVVDETPPAGTDLAKGSTVTITVARTPAVPAPTATPPAATPIPTATP